jgi:hypothetical protein
MAGATRVLDGVYSLAQLDAIEPDAIIGELRAEAADASDVESLETSVRETVAALDAMCTRAMKVLLEHALAMEPSIAQPTRNVFASTVVAYAGRTSLLRERARDVAARGGAREPEAAAERVVEAAERVLGLRCAIIDGVLAVVAERARSLVTETDAKARDRREPEAVRKRASALRRELEAIASEPARIAMPLAERLAAWPEQIDEPDPSTEPSWADMIELD